METINISKKEYEELLRKAQELSDLQNQNNLQEQESSIKEIKTINDLPNDLREEFKIWEKASDEDLANWEEKNLTKE